MKRLFHGKDSRLMRRTVWLVYGWPVHVVDLEKDALPLDKGSTQLVP